MFKSGKIKYAIGTIEIISFVIFLAIMTVFVQAYERLPRVFPDTVASSVFSKLGGKNVFIYVFILAASIYGLLFIIKRFPRLPSYPVRITPKNVEFEMKLARLTLSIITMLAMMAMLIIMVGLYIVASKQLIYFDIQTPIFIIIGLLVVVVSVYFILAFKFK